MERDLDALSPRRGGLRADLREWRNCCGRMADMREDKLFKDQPMAPEDWDRHLSWRRHCIEPLVFARVFRVLSVVEVWILAVSTFATVYGKLLQSLPGAPVLCSRDYMVVFQLTSFALALLMVFRTNTAHARWWEARQAIGRWLNSIRNTQRLLPTWLPPSEAHIVSEVARWLAALTPVSAAYLCRDPAFVNDHCSDLLNAEELSWLRGCANPPVKVLMVLSRIIKRSSLTEWERMQIEVELSAFDNALGACERITRQAIPIAYTRHTSRCIIAYLTFLPFALYPYFGWVTVPVSMGLAFLLVGIENIGVQIECPTRVLPMHSFCVGNKASALAMARAAGVVGAIADAGLATAAVRQAAYSDSSGSGFKDAAAAAAAGCGGAAGLSGSLQAGGGGGGSVAMSRPP